MLPRMAARGFRSKLASMAVYSLDFLDVGIGDAVMEPLEVIEGREWLAFAGIASLSWYMVPREQQFAEKLHV